MGKEVNSIVKINIYIGVGIYCDMNKQKREKLKRLRSGHFSKKKEGNLSKHKIRTKEFWEKEIKPGDKIDVTWQSDYFSTHGQGTRSMTYIGFREFHDYGDDDVLLQFNNPARKNIIEVIPIKDIVDVKFPNGVKTEEKVPTLNKIIDDGGQTAKKRVVPILSVGKEKKSTSGSDEIICECGGSYQNNANSRWYHKKSKRHQLYLKNH